MTTSVLVGFKRPRARLWVGRGEESIFCQVESIFRVRSLFVFCVLRIRCGTLSSDDYSEISGHQALGISPTGTNAFSHFSNNDIRFGFYLGSVTCPAKSNAAFKPGEKYPLLIFSHGLGAFR